MSESTLVGTPGNDALYGTDSDDLIIGGAGQDHIDAGWYGHDTVLFGRGDGIDHVTGGGRWTDSSLTVRLASGITLADVDFRREDSSLVLSITGTQDKLFLSGYFDDFSPDRFGNIVFADGAVLDRAAVDRKTHPGDDWVSPPLTPTTPVTTLDGGLGNDSLSGTDGDDILYGDAGNDQMWGSGGNNTYLFGRGDGQDTVFTDSPFVAASDTVQFANGITVADVDARHDNGDLVLSLKGSNDTLRLSGYFGNDPMSPPHVSLIRFADGSSWDRAAIDRKLGTSDDNLHASPQGGLLDGGAGNDFLQGGSGDDILYGDTGNDMIDAGWQGHDVVHFGRGDGQDYVTGSGRWTDSSLTVQLGSGITLADVDFQRDGSNLVLSLTGTQDKLILSGYFDDFSPGRFGNIVFADGAALDRAAVDRKIQPGDDWVSPPLTPTTPVTTLDGGLGNDSLSGTDGDDILYGDAGNDQMWGSGGNNTYLFGRGDGQDTVFSSPYYATATNTVRLGGGITAADLDVRRDGNDLLLAIQGSPDSLRLAGYYSDDPMQPQPQPIPIVFADGSIWDRATVDRKIIRSDDWVSPLPTSTGSLNTIDGGLGNDSLYGTHGDGDNIFYGDAGNDQMWGSGGNNTYLFGRGDGQDTVFTDSPFVAASDTVQFANGITVADVDARHDNGDLVLSLKGSNDTLRLSGYFGNDPMNPPHVSLIRFADGSTWDRATIDRKLGTSDDNLSANPQGGLLDGGAGNDFLYGGDGNDTFYGDSGNDYIDAGWRGHDTVFFGRGDGQDYVTGSGRSMDSSLTVQLGSGITLADVDFQRDGSSLVLSLTGTQDKLILSGYFDDFSPGRFGNIVFADGAALDRATVDRKTQPGDDWVSPPLTPTGPLTTIDGGLGHDSLGGTGGDDILYGDAGNDQMWGGAGHNTYLFGRGDGQDTVFPTPYYTPTPTTTTVRLGSGITAADLDVQRDGNDLVLAIQGGTDSLRLAGYYSDDPMQPPRQTPRILFGDGSSWDRATVDRKIIRSNDSVSPVSTSTGVLNTIDGGSGDDSLYGTHGDGDNIFYGDAGNDQIWGSGGNNTYLFGRGDGQDTVFTNSPFVAANDTVQFANGITVADVDARHDNGDLVLSLKGSNDTLRLSGYFGNDPMNPPHVSLIRFADGSSWDRAAIDRKLGTYDDNLHASPQGGLLDGGAGNDFLQGGSGDDILYGDTGNDMIDAGWQGHDVVHFGRGDGQDYVTGSGRSMEGSLTVRLGSGITLADVDFRRDGSNLVLSLTGTQDKLILSGYFDDFSPGRFGNIVFADGAALDRAAVDRKTQPGDDWVSPPLTPTGPLTTIDGGLGHDSLGGTGGDDILYGDAGNDQMWGGAGHNTYLFGRGDGQDTVFSSSDFVTVSNTVRLGSGITAADVDVQQDNGDLVLTLQGSTDTLRLAGYFQVGPEQQALIRFADGGTWDGAVIGRKLMPNDDWLWPSTPEAGTTLVDGGLGNDTLLGTDGDNILYGDAGNDELSGGGGHNTYLFGRGDGQDTVFAGTSYTAAHDTVQFAHGITVADVDLHYDNGDLVLSLHGSTDSLRLAGYFGPTGELRWSAIRFADGSSWDRVAIERKLGTTDDNLHATPQGGLLDGGAGNDFVQGGSGDDILYGDIGDDMIDAGWQGHDTVFFGRGDGIDHVTGGGRSMDGSLTVRLGSDIALADVELQRHGGNLVLSLIGSEDRLVLSGYFDSFSPGKFGTIIFADGTAWGQAEVEARAIIPGELLTGDVGNDHLVGTVGNDTLIGLSGDDTLQGDIGDDLLDGGAGNDTLDGGPGGRDTYVFDRSSGNDAIANLHTSGPSDRLLLGAGILPTDVDLYRDFGNLVLRIASNGAGVNLQDYLLWGSSSKIDIVFADGTTWDPATVLRKLDGRVGMPLPTPDGVLEGSYGDDVLMGDLGGYRFHGDRGNDVMVVNARGQADIFYIGRYDGNDTLRSAQGGDFKDDTVQFGDLISAANVNVVRNNNDLVLSVRNSFHYQVTPDGRLVQAVEADSTLRIEGYFNHPGDAAPSIRFADGGSWDRAAIDRKLVASNDPMAFSSGKLLDGGAGDDDLQSSGNSTLYGDTGFDTMRGVSHGTTTYLFGHGDGNDVVIGKLNGGSPPDDIVRIAPNVSSSQVYLRRSANDLVLAINASGDTLTMRDYFGNPGSDRSVLIAFGDGSTWNPAEVARRLASDSADLIVGTWSNDTLDSGPGNDSLFGLVGNDTLQGGTGDDWMSGGAGDDLYFVDNASDSIVEAANEGNDTVRATVSHALAANVEVLELTSGRDGTGNSLANRLYGHAGANILDGGAGADSMYGGAGDDIYIVDNTGDRIFETMPAGPASGTDTVRASVSHVLELHVENLELTGTAAINGTGNTQANRLQGNAAANILDGGAGADTMQGGAGDDIYVVSQGDRVIELANQGLDTVRTAVTYFLAEFVENLELTGTAEAGAFGNDLDNRLTGNSAANVLDGGLGADEMAGGAGDDTYLVDDMDDTVSELEDEGYDTVSSSVSHVLGANLEVLELTGEDEIDATGNELDNLLIGNAAANVLDGGGGYDELAGGTGDDLYLVEDGFDAVLEQEGEGEDTVRVQGEVDRYDLAENVENLVLTGEASTHAVGNALANRIQGNDGANLLDGNGGEDTLAGGAGDDEYIVDSEGDIAHEEAGHGIDTIRLEGGLASYTLGDHIENLVLSGEDGRIGIGNALDNSIAGNRADNRLEGGAGNDTLVGGGGRDTLIGGAGDDTYVIQAGDTVVLTELADQGVDTVLSHVDHTLGTRLENLALLGDVAVTGTGNAGNNVLTGNANDNVLNGLAGADFLDGREGADRMVGGTGNDTYVVDHAGDVVVEGAGAGSDTVLSSISYTLGTSLENLSLLGGDNIDATGNSQENILVGNDGDNRLDGGADNDVMQGGWGNDTYIVDHSGDLVLEESGAGIDTVVTSVSLALAANVENLTAAGSGNRTLTGNALGNVLTGNAGDNTLHGLAGNDTLAGGAGKDTLNGGAGDDVLVGGTGSDTYGFERGGGIDLIREDDSSTAARDRVVFGSGIQRSDVSFQQSGNDLWATLNGGADRLVMENWYLGTRYRVEEFQFASGSAITAAQAQALASAMAAFPASGAATTAAVTPDRNAGVDLAVGIL